MFIFKSLLSVGAISVMLGSSAYAQGQVPPDIHQSCLNARDYNGCVKAMLGIEEPMQRTVDQTNRPGLLAEMGNQCPAGYAYAGGGRCRSVSCRPMGIFGKNEPQLAGKGHSCKGKNLEYGLSGRGSLRWGDNYTNASINPQCPLIEMGMGDPNSCYTARKTGVMITTGIFVKDNRNASGYYVVDKCVGTCLSNKLDIQPGDVLISRNGRPIPTIPKPLSDGQRLTYVVERSGKQHTVSAVAVQQKVPHIMSLPQSNGPSNVETNEDVLEWEID